MVNKIKTIIIEDEPLARDLIKAYLKDYPEIEIIAECEDGFKGLKSINDNRPDLIFLDVQMPKLTGFEMLEVMEQYPLIIFTTAYEQYAIKAFEKNAIDYLLKPFSRDRFAEAIKKVRERSISKDGDEKSIRNIVADPPLKDDLLTRIVIRQGSKINVIPVDNIIYLEAQDDYVMIYTEEGKFLKQQTMKYFESHLDTRSFIRIHRSYILHIDAIGYIEPYEKESYRIILKNKNMLPLSKSGYTRIKEKFGI